MKLFSLLGVGLAMAGCASVTGSTLQPITVKTISMDGGEVRQALCELSNSDGTFFLYTPGTVTIGKSSQDLKVICRKEGYPDGGTTANSGGNGAVLGNIVAGGVVGALVDVGSGAAFEYPSNFVIRLGVMSIGIEAKAGDKVVVPISGVDYSIKVLDVTYTLGQETRYGGEVITSYNESDALKSGAKVVFAQSEIKRMVVEY